MSLVPIARQGLGDGGGVLGHPDVMRGASFRCSKLVLVYNLKFGAVASCERFGKFWLEGDGG